jgi:hypothetical protein
MGSKGECVDGALLGVLVVVGVGVLVVGLVGVVPRGGGER